MSPKPGGVRSTQHVFTELATITKLFSRHLDTQDSKKDGENAEYRLVGDWSASRKPFYLNITTNSEILRRYVFLNQNKITSKQMVNKFVGV